MPGLTVGGIFAKLDQGGASRFSAVPTGSRYRLLPFTDLNAAKLANTNGSALITNASNATGVLLIFSDPFGTNAVLQQHEVNFDGAFVQLTHSGPGQLTANLSSHGFLVPVQSALVVATEVTPEKSIEHWVSFRDVFLHDWNKVLDKELGDAAQRTGDPILTWEMFPHLVGLNRHQTLLKIIQGITVFVPWWPDYQALIVYWIRLFPSHKALVGHVAHSAQWVESGAKHDDVAAVLAPKVHQGAATLQSQLDARLKDFRNKVPPLSTMVSDVYLLPGRQLKVPAPSGVTIGSTFDDITIVIEFTP